MKTEFSPNVQKLVQEVEDKLRSHLKSYVFDHCDEEVKKDIIDMMTRELSKTYGHKLDFHCDCHGDMMELIPKDFTTALYLFCAKAHISFTEVKPATIIPGQDTYTFSNGSSVKWEKGTDTMHYRLAQCANHIEINFT